MQIDTLLVANRGEIARRIIRTARAMGIRTVAVYAEPDRDAPHAREADAAFALGGTSATDSYLSLDRILAAAAATGADAVHPGYGFLAENADAARAVTRAGLVWVGPDPDVIARMGDKVEAKAVAAAIGVPMLPSATLTGDADFEWRQQVAAIGYPLVVKAAAGGGGKGMRLVLDPESLPDAVRTARREAEASFGDGTVFAERWLDGPRHVEIQVVADRHGNRTHLGERECSIQRRHQKLVEEAPSPAVDDRLRTRMADAAVGLAAAIHYDNVGTVEFLVDAEGRDFYFLEMNTRLQVEHPVTELTWGLDLVRLQLEIATGERLDPALASRAPSGHAIEARVYAEDPSRGWAPSTGTVHRWRPDRSTRVDSGVESGSLVSAFYDPLLAKVIVHAPTRDEAAARLAAALRELEVHGVTTNRDHLVATLEHEAFLEGATTTDFVDRHAALLDARPGPATRAAHLVAAALAGQHRRRRADRHWHHAPGGWRNCGPRGQQVSYLVDDETDPVRVTYQLDGDRAVLTVGPDLLEGRVLAIDHDQVRLELNGLAVTCRVHTVGDVTWVNSPGGQTRVIERPRFPDTAAATAIGGPTAPTPGRVLAVEVSPGDRVAAGDTLVLLEAMKVEHRIVAAVDGVVAEVLVTAGDNVDAHQLLVRFEEP